MLYYRRDGQHKRSDTIVISGIGFKTLFLHTLSEYVINIKIMQLITKTLQIVIVLNQQPSDIVNKNHHFPSKVEFIAGISY